MQHLQSTDGKSEKIKKARPLISYITVCYNSEKTLEATISSVQDCKSFVSCEHIIIDGNSCDGTSKILLKYRAVLDAVLVEDDRGVYHAMNKGISLAKGEYICFVNSDDKLIAEGVNSIKHLLTPSLLNKTIIATSAIATDANNAYYWSPSPLDNLLVFKCPNMCHNAIYAHYSCFNEIGSFDTSLKIAADSDWLIRAYRNGAAFHLVNISTVTYSLGGLSSDVIRHSHDMVEIARKHYPSLDLLIIRSLFYHLICWKERKQVFAMQPHYNLRETIKLASDIYPELLHQSSNLQTLCKRILIRVYFKIHPAIKNIFW